MTFTLDFHARSLFEGVLISPRLRAQFQPKAPDGTVIATSKRFDYKAAAVAGIAAVREYAGMGLDCGPFPDGQPRGPAGGT